MSIEEEIADLKARYETAHAAYVQRTTEIEAFRAIRDRRILEALAIQDEGIEVTLKTERDWYVQPNPKVRVRISVGKRGIDMSLAFNLEESTLTSYSFSGISGDEDDSDKLSQVHLYYAIAAKLISFDMQDLILAILVDGYREYDEASAETVRAMDLVRKEDYDLEKAIHEKIAELNERRKMAFLNIGQVFVEHAAPYMPRALKMDRFMVGQVFKHTEKTVEMRYLHVQSKDGKLEIAYEAGSERKILNQHITAIVNPREEARSHTRFVPILSDLPTLLATGNLDYDMASMDLFGYDTAEAFEPEPIRL